MLYQTFGRFSKRSPASAMPGSPPHTASVEPTRPATRICPLPSARASKREALGPALRADRIKIRISWRFCSHGAQLYHLLM